MPATRERILQEMSTMAERAGIDTSVCEFCEEPLDDREDWTRGLDGCGAHDRCLRATGISPRKK